MQSHGPAESFTLIFIAAQRTSEYVREIIISSTGVSCTSSSS